MTNRSTLLVAAIAGLSGGLVARYVSPEVAFAQDKTTVTNDIRAQSFTLVDSSNHTIGKFTVERDGDSTSKRVVLKDAAGREIWSAGSSLFRPLNDGVISR